MSSSKVKVTGDKKRKTAESSPSFLSDRSQYVAVSNERSETVRCVSGVPQGLVLGPLLFSLYVAPGEACQVLRHGRRVGWHYEITQQA